MEKFGKFSFSHSATAKLSRLFAGSRRENERKSFIIISHESGRNLIHTNLHKRFMEIGSNWNLLIEYFIQLKELGEHLKFNSKTLLCLQDVTIHTIAPYSQCARWFILQPSPVSLHQDLERVHVWLKNIQSHYKSASSTMRVDTESSNEFTIIILWNSHV